MRLSVERGTDPDGADIGLIGSLAGVERIVPHRVKQVHDLLGQLLPVSRISVLPGLWIINVSRVPGRLDWTPDRKSITERVPDVEDSIDPIFEEVSISKLWLAPLEELRRPMHDQAVLYLVLDVGDRRVNLIDLGDPLHLWH
jgi:hypothetical protein